MEREKMERGKSELRMAIDDLCLPSSGDGEYQEQQGKVRRSSTMDLLCVSNQLLRVLDAIGPTLLVLRQDIKQNVETIQYLHARDSLKYASLTAIVIEEVEEGTSKKAHSCTRAIIWLARCDWANASSPQARHSAKCSEITGSPCKRHLEIHGLDGDRDGRNGGRDLKEDQQLYKGNYLAG
ncbi:hypothetical protein TRIUR3_29548 [Triticum urartu]|uniref:Glycolipid transfer protein domain-containing protein n=1 Tax=Triticum urartu TaxID=4572 RepID=M7XLX6_TRIUA|nr:hypothetical protein TRIUR3_29548 [Triticum urartu]